MQSWLRGILVVFAASSLGCGSKGGEQQADRGSIPECDAYAARLAVCLGREQPAVTHAEAQAVSLVSADDAQRARMKTTCARDLERLKSSCH